MFFLSKIFTLPLGGGKISAVKSLVAKSPNFKDRTRSAHYFAVVVVVADVRANRKHLKLSSEFALDFC